MSDITDPNAAMTLICQTIRNAGCPLSRLEIARAIEPEVIADLRSVLTNMLESGLLNGHMDISDNNTSIFRYQVAEGLDCKTLEIEP